MKPTYRLILGGTLLWIVPHALNVAPLNLPLAGKVFLWLIIAYGAIFWFLSGLETFHKFRNSQHRNSIRVNMGVIFTGAITGALLSFLFWHLLQEGGATAANGLQDDVGEPSRVTKSQNPGSGERIPKRIIEEGQNANVVDLERAKECLADFSSQWSSSDVYILVAPISEDGGISIGHPYIGSKDTPEDFDRSNLMGGFFIHLMDAGIIRVGDNYYSALLWNGGIPGGGLLINGGKEEWEEGYKWIELAKKSGSELLRGEYGVEVKGGSPDSAWALVVASVLWDSEWRKEAPGNEHYAFPAYPSSVETWKRLISKLE